ncbi:hypothetical protein Ddye_023866 [Dipteronia dyeriana]|uniref:Peptidase S8/S53 domain-containing protein n=1 Tax=Dipteronia dyeriana TaxID=168575 RepID=A0AAD9TUD4_9ROSI|nr:hypothetical protein Ddye_023866 [Dipteronia dyeriana]
MEGVVSFFPRKPLLLQTTRSWDFMGFSETVKRNPSGEIDIIIGVIGTGIWPKLESFNDEGNDPLPKKCKGACEGGSNFTCNKNPQAKILKSEVVKSVGDPVTPDFSSRGPSSIIAYIIKPDISAPGVGILAGYPPILPPSGLHGLDKRSVKYNLMTGTSVACAHAAGAAAYVKSFHPYWSPSTVKSAVDYRISKTLTFSWNDFTICAGCKDADLFFSLLCIAWPMNSTINPDGEFAFGTGHIDPVKAIYPGLVY